MQQKQSKKLIKLEEDFKDLRDPIKGRARIEKALEHLESDPTKYLAKWYSFSKENGDVYPDQGLVRTPYDHLNYRSSQMLPYEKTIETLRLRLFFLEMFNHQYRINFLRETDKKPYTAPEKIDCLAIETAKKTGLSLSIGDIGASVVGSQKERQSRTLRYAQGPFVKIGKHARMIFVGSDSPDVWNTSAAISTMAASHCLATVPRNGVLVDIKRQTDLAKKVFADLKELKDLILSKRTDKDEVYGYWKRNVGGVIEATHEKALIRATELYKAGIRTFRIYSPEPGMEIIKTTKMLRKRFGSEIEIFTGQIVDVEQAKQVEAAGADGIFVGIGGGGRCITGVRSGSVIDWPMLVWELRGEIKIPVIVEGGASDHIALTLLLGAAGIGVSRVVSGGTIESPGGLLYCADNNGKLYKPYGGEASARTKFLENKVLPFEIPSFVEGETSKSELSFIEHALPTLTYNLHHLNEEAILAMVFRNVASIADLHNINPSPLKRSTNFDSQQRQTH